MKISELLNEAKSTKVVNVMGSMFTSEESKAQAVSLIEEMLSLMGDHEIPKAQDGYADLMDETLTGEPSDEEASTQMDLARSIISINSAIASSVVMPL